MDSRSLHHPVKDTFRKSEQAFLGEEVEEWIHINYMMRWSKPVLSSGNAFHKKCYQEEEVWLRAIHGPCLSLSLEKHLQVHSPLWRLDRNSKYEVQDIMQFVEK